MTPEPIAFIATCDLAGLVRGKSIPLAGLPARMARGVGITHSNIMLSPFGPILDTPFGTEGDLLLVPDPTTQIPMPMAAGPDCAMLLGNFRTLEGTAWEGCPRSFLANALTALRQDHGFDLLATFEQEMVYTGVEDRPGAPYTLDALRRQGAFGGTLLALMRQAGLEPDSFLAEYGPRQYEVTAGPKPGLRAADEAVMVREYARVAAQTLGHRAILAPMVEPNGIGNGTHIHWSLTDANGDPATHDPLGAHGLSPAAEHFTAGILHHLPAIVAVTAPCPISYLRLRPGRWAPTRVDLGVRDRGSAVRICPVTATAPESIAKQFNVEFRVADATASPYLALGAIVHAGLDGLTHRRRLQDLTPQDLPASLAAALDLFAASDPVGAWFGPLLRDLYLRFKRAELRAVADLDDADLCRRYVEIY